MIKDVEKNLIVKSYDFIEANYRLTAPETKIIALLASVIDKDDKDFKDHIFKASELLELTGLGLQNYTELKKLTKNLMQKILEIKYEDRLIQVAFLSCVEYYDSKGLVNLCFDPHLKPHLLNLKNKFIKYKLETVLNLKSFYSIRFYELLIKWEKVGKFTLSVKELRKVFNIKDNKYKLYSDLKKRVILTAQEELKDKADLYFDFKELKVSRKVSKIEFTIKLNNINKELVKLPQIEVLENIETIPSENIISNFDNETFKNLQKIGVSKKTCEALISEYPLDLINKQIEYLKYREAKKPAGLLIKAIEEDWEVPQEYLNKEKKDKELKAKEELEKQIEEMKKRAKKAKYLILKSGDKRKIITVTVDGDLKLLNEDTNSITFLIANEATKYEFE